MSDISKFQAPDGTIYDLKDDSARNQIYALSPVGNASGNPIIIDDGADDVPIKSLKVTLEPQQDLHGYDKPWPAGGGKNLLPMTVAGIKAENTSGTWSGNAYTVNGVTFNIQADSNENVVGINANGTASANAFLIFSSFTNFLVSGTGYKINGNSSDASAYLQIINSGGGGVANIGSEYTLNYAGENNRLCIRVNSGSAANNVVIKPMIRLASVSDATFEPYSNICPITGYESVDVVRCGKNLLDIKNETSASTSHVREYAISLPVGTYTVSARCHSTANTDCGTLFMYTDDTNSPIEYINNDIWSSTTISATKPVRSVRFYSSTTWGTSQPYTMEVYDAQVEKSSTATPYEPYKGDTYTIKLPDEAGTVYSGTLNPVTGELVVDKACKIIDQSLLSDNGTTSTFHEFAYGALNDKKYGLNNFTTNEYRVLNSTMLPDTNCVVGRATSAVIAIRMSVGVTLEEAKTFLTNNPLQVCYELATPLVYHLTPTDVTTLLGYNRIASDGMMELEYCRDTASNEIYLHKSALSSSEPISPDQGNT